jgi:hypothetical protein
MMQCRTISPVIKALADVPQSALGAGCGVLKKGHPVTYLQGRLACVPASAGVAVALNQVLQAPDAFNQGWCELVPDDVPSLLGFITARMSHSKVVQQATNATFAPLFTCISKTAEHSRSAAQEDSHCTGQLFKAPEWTPWQQQLPTCLQPLTQRACW